MANRNTGITNLVLSIVAALAGCASSSTKKPDNSSSIDHRVGNTLNSPTESQSHLATLRADARSDYEARILAKAKEMQGEDEKRYSGFITDARARWDASKYQEAIDLYGTALNLASNMGDLDKIIEARMLLGYFMGEWSNGCPDSNRLVMVQSAAHNYREAEKIAIALGAAALRDKNTKQAELYKGIAEQCSREAERLKVLAMETGLHPF